MATLAAQIVTDWDTLARTPEVKDVQTADKNMAADHVAALVKEALGEVDGTDKTAMLFAKCYTLQYLRAFLEHGLSAEDARTLDALEKIVARVMASRTETARTLGVASRDRTGINKMFPYRR